MNKFFGGAFCLCLAAVFARPQSITVTKPSANEPWVKGQSQTISWTITGSMPNTVRITLRNQDSTSVVREIADGAPNSGSYSWLVPADIPDGKYHIRVKIKNADILDDSDVFIIKAGPGVKKMEVPASKMAKPKPYHFIKIKRPAENSKWKMGQTMHIMFEAHTIPDDGYRIDLYDQYGTAKKFPIYDGAIVENPPGWFQYEWPITLMDFIPDGWYQLRVASIYTQDVDNQRIWLEYPTEEVKIPVEAYIVNGRLRRWNDGRYEHSYRGNEAPEQDPPNCGEKPGQARVGFHEGRSGDHWNKIFYRSSMGFGLNPLKSNYKLEWLKKAVLRIKKTDYGFRQNCGYSSCIDKVYMLQAPWGDFFATPAEYIFSVPADMGEEFTYDLYSLTRAWYGGTKPNYGILLTSVNENYPPPDPALSGCVAFYQATLELTFAVPIH